MTADRRYTVQTLLVEVERVLQRHWPMILVEGEVQQLQVPASGHAYLMLRDGEAQLPVVMWRNDWRMNAYKPAIGDRVLARGRFGVYAAQSRYQLYASVIRPSGEGELARELAARRERMERDGLLDPRRKRPLPRFPAVIGLATSPTGAALQDFLRVSRERWPAARILVAGCVVQGAEAPSSVIRALELLCEDGRPDVIVVTRGGGSKSDLLAFHDEALARWIATSPIPVVSAVGHEIDTSLCDLAADAAAPTPSAAAVLVLPDGPALAQRVDELSLGMRRALERALHRKRRDLVGWTARLRPPGERVSRARERHDALVRRLAAGLERQVTAARNRLERADVRLDAVIERRLAAARSRAERVSGRLQPRLIPLAGRRAALVAARARLEALSPLAVLSRGYAIVEGPRGIVRDADGVSPGDPLTVRVGAGSFAAEVVPRR